MVNFDDIEDLVSYMFENLDNEDNRISVVVNKDIAIYTLKELLNYKNVILSICDIDSDIDYKREYIVSLYDDTDSDKWYVSVEKVYLIEKKKYLSVDGYVLFHEDVNSKILIDMKNNEFMPLGRYDWFTIGEYDSDVGVDDDTDLHKSNNVDLFSKSTGVYYINGEEVDKETYFKMVEKFKKIEYEMHDYDILNHFIFSRLLREL